MICIKKERRIEWGYSRFFFPMIYLTLIKKLALPVGKPVVPMAGKRRAFSRLYLPLTNLALLHLVNRPCCSGNFSPFPYLICMCNWTALPPHRPAAKRHKSGTAAALRRSRTAKSAPSQRTKVSQIRYLCAPKCGNFVDAGTAWPRSAHFFGLKSPRTGAAHPKTYEYVLLG